MPAKQGLRRHAVQRRGWILWGVTFLVLAALTAAVPMLYLPLLHTSSEALAEPYADAYYAMISLCGMVMIFCLYTALKQRELNHMRDLLEEEEREIDLVRTRLSELSALFQVSTALNLQLRLDDILEIIVRRVVSTLRAQQASIMIYSPMNGVLETRASYGLESEFARHAKKKLGEGIAGWVAEHNEAVQLDGNKQHDKFGSDLKPNRNITSALSLPLRVGDRCVGVLNVNRINHPETFQQHHREILRMFAEHVGAVIDRAEMMERLGSRAKELEASNAQLSETNRLKDVFLSTASHELKTPLTSVIGYAELLDDNEQKLNPEQRGEFMRRLRAEAMRLLALIEDILDLSRLESGKLTLHRVAVAPAEVGHAAVETARRQAERRNVSILESYDPSLPAMLLDEVKMRQVVVNLLVNAIKFSPDRGTINVRTVRDDDHMRFEVADQGEGIDPEEATHIFELFGQGVKQKDQNQGGLGIGLHLVKRLSELHGGHVGVNSTAGKGSTFWVRLPLALADASHEAEESLAAA